MRLIDIDELKKRYHEILSIGYRHSYGKGLQEGLRLAINQPTVDAVEVVRCKDCKYYRESEHPERSGIKFCFRLMHPAEDRRIGYNFSGDDFCSCGEKRE